MMYTFVCECANVCERVGEFVCANVCACVHMHSAKRGYLHVGARAQMRVCATPLGVEMGIEGNLDERILPKC